MRRCCRFLLVAFLGLPPAFAAPAVVSFDAHFTGPGEHIADASLADEAATFLNETYESWGSIYWAGFAFSTVSNTTANSHTNQYAAAQGFPRAYAVGYHDYYQNIAPEIAFALPCAPKSVRLNNTTYAALTIRDGDGYGFAQPFASNDFFVLTLTAYDREDRVVATTNHYLADFRDGKTFIQTNWTTLDLAWMPPNVASIVGTLTTSDVGAYGPNTPMYFAWPISPMPIPTPPTASRRPIPPSSAGPTAGRTTCRAPTSMPNGRRPPTPSAPHKARSVGSAPPTASCRSATTARSS